MLNQLTNYKEGKTMELFKTKSEIHENLLAVFSGENMSKFNHADCKEAYLSMSDIMRSAQDNINPSDLANEVIGDLVAIESILKTEGRRQIQYGKVFLPREFPRDFMRKKGQALDNLINRLSETIKHS